jgi:vacuolar-type H+-ATPase subunit I/STV1
MGQKCTGKRQYLLFRIAGCLMFTCLLAGCLYPPERWKTEEHLATANYYLGRGNFDASLRESRAVLSLYPQLLGDRALFQIGLIYSHPENPEHDFTKAREAFGALVNRYPESPLRPQAEMWIMVLRNLQDMESVLSAKNEELARSKDQLKDQLEKVKKLQEKKQKINETKEDHYEKAIEAKDRQIKELEENIDQLKEVDIKIEEKKRKVTP